MSTYWDYSGLYGEDKWSQTYRTGLRQSPINILTRNVTKNEYLIDQIVFKNEASTLSVENKGNNVSFKPIFKVNADISCISGGPLNGTYCFEECHIHWGRNDNKGCEHEIDGKRYDAELHLVHRLKECTFLDALNRANGLCVLGVFLEVVEEGAKTPLFLSNLIALTKKVHYKGENVEDSGQQIDPYKILENISKEYFTYEGSLTTPPLSECVRWVVFKTPIKVSREDYKLLQNILAIEKNSTTKIYHDPFIRNENSSVVSIPMIGDNFRSCCRSDGRKVESSF